MIFKVIDKKTIEKHETTFSIGELELENLLCLEPGEELDYSIFGEDLLFLGRQIALWKKRFDMLAIDKLGRCVVIELKKDNAYYSTDMQALDYIATLRSLTGEEFLRFVTDGKPQLKEAVQNYVSNVSQLNKSARIILVAQGFQDSVFSLGRWISDHGVSFKCIKYSPLVIGQERYLAFSTVFSCSLQDEYAEALLNDHVMRKPRSFWHILNFGISNEEWWNYCCEKGIIALNYENIEAESCPGYRKINEYMEGDNIFIWANGVGCIGYGEVVGPYLYQEHPIKSLAGHYHTRQVKWISTIPFSKAVNASDIKKIGLNNPRQAKQEILQNHKNLEKVIGMLQLRVKDKKSA